MKSERQREGGEAGQTIEALEAKEEVMSAAPGIRDVKTPRSTELKFLLYLGKVQGRMKGWKGGGHS